MSPDLSVLESKAKRIRIEVLEGIKRAKKGHIGGTYSCVELLVALYYGGFLKVDPENPRDPSRDRVFLSKGHACLALYSIFLDLGFISREAFESYGKDGGLGGQLDIGIPGAEYNTGSLGHALGIGVGVAMSAKLDGKDLRAYVIMGDGEMFEGSVWEAILFAGQHRLKGLVGVIDRNRLAVTEVLEDDEIFKDFGTKLHNFGWDFMEIDGHSVAEVMDAFAKARESERPFMIMANTIKGKGVSFIEGNSKWHAGVPNEEEIARARKELGI